jgi:hypothetical protein
MASRFGGLGLFDLEQRRQAQAAHPDLSQSDHCVASVKHRVVLVSEFCGTRSIAIDLDLV